MQVHIVFLLLTVNLVAWTESRPMFSNLVVSNYEYPAADISAEPQYLQYQDPFSPYYFYNVHTDVKTVPTTVLSNGKPAIAHIPTYNFYYQPSVYDLGFPLNPVYPVLKPQLPGALPKPAAPPAAPPTAPPIAPPTAPPSTTTPRPEEDQPKDADDGIEKLDIKLKPETENMKSSEKMKSEEDDTVAVDTI